MPWADSHCHIHDDRVDLDEAVAAALAVGVHRLVNVGCDQPTSVAAVAAAKRACALGVDAWATLGQHPHEAVYGIDWLEPMLRKAAAEPEAHRVVAVGEAGLDYFYDHSPRDVQQEMFALQVELAHRFELPLVIHTRDAWDDTFAILEREGTPASTIFHCFSGGPNEAAACLALHDGVALSFSGIVTFKTADDLRAAVSLTPLERLLIETDSPYLAPVPHRGKRNQPSYVPLVAVTIAEVKGVSVDDIAATTWAATAKAFRLDASAGTANTSAAAAG